MQVESPNFVKPIRPKIHISRTIGLIIFLTFFGLTSIRSQRNRTDSASSTVDLTFTKSGLVVEVKPGLNDALQVVVNGIVINPVSCYQQQQKTVLCLWNYTWQPRQTYRVEIHKVSDQTLIAGQRAKSPAKPMPYRFQTLKLSRIWPSLPTNCRSTTISVAGDRIAIGTNRGHVAVWDLQTSAVIWKKRFSESIIKQVVLDQEGQWIYISQQSADAWLFCYQITNPNKPKWQYRLADDIESSTPTDPDAQWAWLQLPTAAKFTLFEDDLLVAGVHAWPNGDQTNVKSQLYRFEARTGNLKWRFPPDQPLPLFIRWFDVSSSSIAFVCDKQSLLHSKSDQSTDSIPPGSLVVLGLENGQKQWQHTFQPLTPHFQRVTFWRGVSISPDGTHINVTTDDGRAFIFQQDNLIWQKELTTPIEVSGMSITATAGTVAATEPFAIFVTGDTFIPYHLQTGVSRPPMAHPNGLTLFAYQWNQQLAWHWPLENMPQGLSVQGQFAVIATASYGESSANSQEKPNAISVFDLKKIGDALDKYAYTYRVGGPIPYDQLAVSARWIVAVETKSRSNEQPEGKNQIHIIQ